MFSAELAKAAAAIRADGVVAYPTEAVYGLGCSPTATPAVEKLLRLKRRAKSKGLILIARAWDDLAPYCAYPSGEWRRRILNGWPGARTWLLPAKSAAREINGGRATVAVRITAHAVAAALCRACGGALVSTSANLSGQGAARTVAEVRDIFGDELDAILPGAIGGLARPTPIRDGRDGRVVRLA